MSEWRRAWALLLVSYLTATQIIAIVWTGKPSLTAQTLLEAAVAPLLQAAVLRVAPARTTFFLTWAVCAAVQLVVPTVIGLLVFRNLPLTDAVVVALLFVPVIQAASLTLSRPTVWSFMARVRETLDAPLTRPVVWIDLVAIPAGLLWVNHPAIGMAAAGVLQRRWIATKLMAAATVLVFAAVRTAANEPGPAGRTVRVAAATVLALVGFNEFRPWMLNAARSMPPPFGDQPLALLWLEMYAIGLTAVVLLIRRCATCLQSAAPAPAAVFEGASIAIFLAGLALLVNGFLSLQPVKPWSGVAMAFGTMGATLLAVGAIAALDFRR